MNRDKVDELLFSQNTDHAKKHKDRYIDHYLEQYRIYVNIFNSTSDRRNKSNEFFLGLNAGIIAILGYVQTKSIPHASIIFILVPFAGIAICHSWHRMICAYKQLNSAKFKVIHAVEQKLPIALFETEWRILGKGKDKSKYYPLSQIEKDIPLIFILLYIFILFAGIPVDWKSIIGFLVK